MVVEYKSNFLVSFYFGGMRTAGKSEKTRKQKEVLQSAAQPRPGCSFIDRLLGESLPTTRILYLDSIPLLHDFSQRPYVISTNVSPKPILQHNIQKSEIPKRQE